MTTTDPRPVMRWVPATLRGRTEMVLAAPGDDARAQAEAEIEQARRDEVGLRRLYFAGAQFDDENDRTAQASGLGRTDLLPEHKRLHAYSTQIAECVGFMTARLGEGFAIEPDDAAVAKIVDDVVLSNDVISALTEDGDVQPVTDLLLQDALVAQDVAAYVGWNPVEGKAFVQFWESEKVQFEMATATRPRRVTRSEVIWEYDDTGVYREIRERMVYEMAPNDVGIMECRAQKWWDTDQAPRRTYWLGIGVIPWRLLRPGVSGLREYRGQSALTRQVMESADRYNAVEQTGYLIARYNSHSNVAVIGDGATLKLQTDGRLEKDVADVLTFPGGTALEVLTLPTDVQMIEHQRGVLSDAIYASFGITRVDQSTLQGLGGVTGYALEILNMKTDGTFNRVARQWRKDMTGVLNLILDVTAWCGEVTQAVAVDQTTGGQRQIDIPTDPLVPLDVTFDEVPVPMWWLIDPAVIYSNRKIAIRMGTGSVIDDARVRDDFVADLISRQEALRLRGYPKEKIDEIEAEIEAAKPAVPEIGNFGGGGPSDTGGSGSTGGSSVGSTVATTSRGQGA